MPQPYAFGQSVHSSAQSDRKNISAEWTRGDGVIYHNKTVHDAAKGSTGGESRPLHSEQTGMEGGIPLTCRLVTYYYATPLNISQTVITDM